ncbi:hypothetical protein A6C57_26160 [Fibrella sp. ES10-3-2-2]
MITSQSGRRREGWLTRLVPFFTVVAGWIGGGITGEYLRVYGSFDISE